MIPGIIQPGNDARATMRAAGWGSGSPDDAEPRRAPDATVERILALGPRTDTAPTVLEILAGRPLRPVWDRPFGRVRVDAPGDPGGKPGTPRRKAHARAPALKPPPRPALVQLSPPARTCAEVHEDVARLGWPEGGWCE